MLRQNERKMEWRHEQQQYQQQQEEEEEQEKHVKLSKREVQILNCIKSQSRTEKKISKMIRLDILVISPLITELMLKGYVEIMRRRRLFFFSREYCTIPLEGLAALEKAKSPFENLVELVRERALETIDNIAAGSPLLNIAVVSARAACKTLKMLM